MNKFKTGDKVICNGNNDAYVLGYYSDKMVEVRLWSGSRHVGDTCVHENNLISKEVTQWKTTRTNYTSQNQLNHGTI